MGYSLKFRCSNFWVYILLENILRRHVQVIFMETCVCKIFPYTVVFIQEFYKGTLSECDVRKMCCRNIKYIASGGKDWWPLKMTQA